MNCEEAAEFVSALCDGERIPRAAAEHVGECAVCGARLKDYLAMGVELRRVASLESMEFVSTRTWEKKQQVGSNWWAKGWETMRIPKLAFAMLLVAVVVLGSGVVVMKVGARTQGPVLMLMARPAVGEPVRCALSTVDKNSSFCAVLNPGQSMYAIRVIALDGGRIQLGVRAQFISAVPAPGTWVASLQDVYALPERYYSFEPGQSLQVDVPGTGQMTVTGELMDHMPSLISARDDLDPQQGELRVVSPVLVRGKKVVLDLEGLVATLKENDSKNTGIAMYAPGEGRWILSLTPVRGAVPGRNHLSRVSFTMNGEAYTFLMAAPAARGETIWVAHEPDYKPSREKDGAGEDQRFGGPTLLDQMLVKAPPTN